MTSKWQRAENLEARIGEILYPYYFYTPVSDSSPFVSQSPINIHERSMVNNEGARGMMGRRKERRNVFIMGYATLSLGCCMVCCYHCFINGRLYIFELLSFIFIRVLRPSLRPQAAQTHVTREGCNVIYIP